MAKSRLAVSTSYPGTNLEHNHTTIPQLDGQADTWFETADSLRQTNRGQQGYMRQRGQARFVQRLNWEKRSGDQPVTS